MLLFSSSSWLRNWQTGRWQWNGSWEGFSLKTRQLINAGLIQFFVDFYVNLIKKNLVTCSLPCTTEQGTGKYDLGWNFQVMLHGCWNQVIVRLSAGQCHYFWFLTITWIWYSKFFFIENKIEQIDSYFSL